MLDASNRVEHFRDLAEECRRLAATSFSAQMRKRYSQMADEYDLLAEAEELGTLARREWPLQ
jgi:hypothetical protein